MDDLKGIRVLVTRPQPQADKLADYLRERGADVVIMPMLEISPLSDNELPLPIDISLHNKVIVVSTPAAQSLLKHHPLNVLSAQWFTPGKGTGDFLAANGIPATCPDTLFTSEAMLELPALQNVAGQKVLLVQGEGGRDLLEQTLTRNGAIVTSMTVYRRSNPDYPPGTLDRTLEDHEINAIVATSGQIVTNLVSHSSNVSSLQELFLLVPSARVSDLAKQVGFLHVQLTDSAGDSDIAAALKPLVSRFGNQINPQNR